MADPAKNSSIDPSKAILWNWEGKDIKGKVIKGQMRANGRSQLEAILRRQGIQMSKADKFKSNGKRIKPDDIAVFTRQLAAMMKAGIPLLQSFDIVGKGHPNPAMGQVLAEIKRDVETGMSLSQGFRARPHLFDELYCNLIEAGESAGILEKILDRIATYLEKTMALKKKVKSALKYPATVLGVAGVVVVIIMIFVIPAFKGVFEAFGAALPAPTLIVIAMSEFFTSYWYAIFGGFFGTIWGIKRAFANSKKLRDMKDRVMLRLPIFGDVILKSTIARWTRTLATMFTAGVPLVDALTSVAGAAGNDVYKRATDEIQFKVSTGTALSVAMEEANCFPVMCLQMAMIGEESGALDDMLNKVADFYEEEVDEAVKGLSSMMEPLIIVLLGTIIGGIVVAMYLPIFKLGSITSN